MVRHTVFNGTPLQKATGLLSGQLSNERLPLQGCMPSCEEQGCRDRSLMLRSTVLALWLTVSVSTAMPMMTSCHKGCR